MPCAHRRAAQPAPPMRGLHQLEHMFDYSRRGDVSEPDFGPVDNSLRSAITTKPAAQASAGLPGRFGLGGRFGFDLRLFEDSRLGFLIGGRIRLVVHRFGLFGGFLFGRFGRGLLNRGLGGLGLRLVWFRVVRLSRIGFLARCGELRRRLDVLRRRLRHFFGKLFRLCRGLRQRLVTFGRHLVRDCFRLLGRLYLGVVNLGRGLHRLGHFLTLDRTQTGLGLFGLGLFDRFSFGLFSLFGLFVFLNGQLVGDGLSLVRRRYLGVVNLRRSRHRLGHFLTLDRTQTGFRLFSLLGLFDRF